jgi:hypothetical protein
MLSLFFPVGGTSHSAPLVWLLIATNQLRAGAEGFLSVFAVRSGRVRAAAQRAALFDEAKTEIRDEIGYATLMRHRHLVPTGKANHFAAGLWMDRTITPPRTVWERQRPPTGETWRVLRHCGLPKPG